MARVYDIVEKLRNKKPTVKIDSEHEFTINTSKNTAIFIKSVVDDDKEEEFKKIDMIMESALGKKAFDYIESLDLEMSAYNTIINVIMAAISDKDLEEMEKIEGSTPRKHK